MDHAIVHTDGGARGNPGPAGIGVVIYDEQGREVRAFGHYLGTATNNRAEYEALIAGLEESRRLGIERISLRLDSELVVRQLEGRYAVKHPDLRPLYESARALLGQFQSWDVRHVRRAQNSRADELVNQAIDRALERSRNGKG